MAYVVNTTQTATANAATYTVTLGAHQANDLLLVLVSQDGGGTAITTSSSGWAMIGTGAASGASRSQWAYKVAASGAEANPTFSGATDDWIGTCVVVRDADASTPFGSLVSGTDFVRSDYNNPSTGVASGSVTTAVDDCLVLYSWNSDGSNQYMICDISEAVAIDKYATSVQSHIIAYRQMGAAGAAPTVNMWPYLTTEGGNGWVLAIRNKSGGNLSSDVRATATVLNNYGNVGNVRSAVTWQAPSNFAATINSITVDTSVSVTTATSAVLSGAEWMPASHSSSSLSTAAAWVGCTHTISSTNMTGKAFVFTWGMNNVSTLSYFGSGSGEGFIVGFSDGTNWSVYRIATAWLGLLGYTAVIDFATATPYASSGTLNLAAVTRVAYMHYRAGSTATSSTFYFKDAVLVDTVAIVGGGATNPSNFADYHAALRSWEYPQWVIKQGAGQILGLVKTKIGDGSSKTYFDSSAQSFEYPIAYGDQYYWNVGNGGYELSVYASSSDNITVGAGVATSTTNQNLTINSSSSTNATYSFAGNSFVGWTPTWKTGVTCNNATFSACYLIDAKAATFQSCLIKASLSTTSAMSIDDGAEIKSCSFTKGSETYALLIAAAGSYDISGTTFSGYTTEINVTATTGTVTITLGTGQAEPSYTSAGATVTFIGDVVYQSVTINGITSGSRVQIYDTTNSSELFNGVVAATTKTWTDSVAASADRDIRVRISYVSGATAKNFIEANIGTCGTTSLTAAVTYLANQTADTVYDNNAIDGSSVTGVTFTDTTVDVININVAAATITWKSIYAAWVAYAFTEAGIASDIDYIDAVDEANYILSNLVVKNTSSPSVPLEITGGYARDASTGAAIDLIDTTGGTIVVAPDHVVSYAVGSGVTSQDKVDIATEVLSQASSAPIYADLRKVTGTAVTGSGAQNDPWGP